MTVGGGGEAPVSVTPFEVTVPEEALIDLGERLARTRWPDEVEGAGWAYGAPVGFMSELVAYWREAFDWRAQERRINAFGNYRAEVGDLGIHFVHERGRGPDPLPLLVLHGWPSSFVEMLELVPLLTDPAGHGGDPADAFDVVVPSLPGHGFSDRPTRPGFEDRQAAETMVELMAGLGYERFGAHAYDLGASVMGLLCLDHPERVVGYHTTSPGNPSPALGPGAPEPTEAERAFLASMEQWGKDEYGYGHLLGTRPQTVAYGLADSPAGLAAWIVEKWYAWTAPPDGNLEAHFTKDDLLANVTIYWVTETINAANRYYYEGRHTRWPGPDDLAHVPLGVALTATQANERPPREYVERLFPDVRAWVELGRGGHFVALEEPRLVAEAIRGFFRGLR
jgi:pimeloyl-ACP methyl ester carboxylesterase